MAKRCNCHRNIHRAIAGGSTFWEAYDRYAKPGYHEHRCECPCKCQSDTLGYGLCVACSFDGSCGLLRQERRGAGLRDLL